MNQVGLFAKFWQPGQVKTRLAADLDDRSACEIYQYFLSDLINQLRDSGDSRTLVYSPSDRKGEFDQAGGTYWQTLPQSDADLGHRMQQFFEHSFQASAGTGDAENGGERNPSAEDKSAEDKPAGDKSNSGDKKGGWEHKTVVIGSDCPQLTPADIEEAFRQLDQHSVVLGPSHDGGYYLIGMKNECFDVFQNIDWSTDRVMDQTRAKLKTLGVGWSELEPKRDIDDLGCLLEFCAEVKAASHPGNAGFVLLGAIEGVLARHRHLQKEGDA